MDKTVTDLGPGALPSDWQAQCVPPTSVAAHIPKPLDIVHHLSSQVVFNGQLRQTTGQGCQCRVWEGAELGGRMDVVLCHQAVKHIVASWRGSKQRIECRRTGRTSLRGARDAVQRGQGLSNEQTIGKIDSKDERLRIARALASSLRNEVGRKPLS